MSKAVGEDALSGIKEHIEGFHTFTVTNQSKVIAEGLMVGIIPAGQTIQTITEKSTGADGWTVGQGDRVRVYNVDIEFH